MNEAILVAAAHWHLQSARDDMDWDGFTLWLEADPAHRSAYDAIVLDDDWVMAHAAAIRGSIPRAPEVGVGAVPKALAYVRRTPALWLGSATGLAAVAALGLVLLPVGRPAPVVEAMHNYAAPLDAPRTLALSDGVRVVLSRGAQLSVPDAAGAPMRLTGTAYFDVAHRPDRILKIQAGGYTISDIGTRFEVANSDMGVRVAVEQGSISLSRNSADGAVHLSAGQGALGYHHGGSIELMSVVPQSVGSFRRGVLVYQNAPLGIVAQEISRYTELPVMVDNTVAQRRFSGALTIGKGKALATNLAELMDIEASERNGTILLSAAGRR